MELKYRLVKVKGVHWDIYLVDKVSGLPTINIQKSDSHQGFCSYYRCDDGTWFPGNGGDYIEKKEIYELLDRVYQDFIDLDDITEDELLNEDN